MTKTYALYLACALILISLMGVMPVAAVGIAGVSPQEGTVGTEVTISGSGFGEKTMEIVLGDEKCQVLAWSDTQIVCTVSKPQLAGEYAITVLAQGDKKPSEPMTFSPFTIRDPAITEGPLVRDGDTVTIAGAFFGDKRGDVRIAYRADGVVVKDAKVADWSMDAVRIRLPDGLTGRFIVTVQNAVGKDFALLDLGGGPPTLVGMTWPSGYGRVESENNARGIAYNGKLYVWSTYYTSNVWQQMIHPKYIDRIEYRTFQNGQLSGRSEMWEARSLAEPAPVIVQYADNGPEKMFVFMTGENGYIYFTRLNGTVWEDGRWVKIADAATGAYISTKMETWEVAPVYDSSSHRLYLYFAKDYKDYLHAVYSDDYGTTWHYQGKVTDSPVVTSAPGAVPYRDALKNHALLAVKDADDKIRVCLMGGNYVASSETLTIPVDDNVAGQGRPFLTDVGNGNIALLYGSKHGTSDYCANSYIPHIGLFDKATGQWGTPYQATSLPELGVAQGEYLFEYQPNGVMDPATNTFWLFYAFGLCGGADTDDTNNGPWWMFNSIPTPGATVGVMLATGTDDAIRSDCGCT